MKLLQTHSISKFQNTLQPTALSSRWLCLAIVTLGFCLLAAAKPVIFQKNNDPNIAENQPETTQEIDAEKKEAKGFPKTPLQFIDAMGYVFVIPFAAASIFAMWFAIERLVILRRNRVIPKHFVSRFLQHLENGKINKEGALEICEQNGSPVANIFAHGVRKWGKPSVELEQAIIDGGERQVSQLRKHLRIINGVATVAPLIGLLGTVIGMIQAFQELELASDIQKSALAIGIAKALLTTATGLCIAIPALILYMYLTGKVDSLVMEMDDKAQYLVNLISSESILEEQHKSRRSETGKAATKKAVAAGQKLRAV